MSNIISENKKRIIYMDLLRVISIFAVVVLHVAAVQWSRIDVNLKEWQILNVYNSSVRWCVPVIFMISGAFLLNPQKKIKLAEIYCKYISRLVIALIITGISYIIFLGVLEGKKIDIQFIINGIKEVIKGNVRYHLWFIYVIIGLYIITPILRTYIKGASKRDIEYFLVIGAIFSIVGPFLMNYYPFSSFFTIITRKNISFGIHYIFYYVSGYYFTSNNFKTSTKVIFYVMAIVSWVFTIFGTSIASRSIGKGYIIFFDYLTPNVMFMSFGIFIVFKEYISKVKYSNSFKKVVSLLSNLSFLIYLIHDAVRVLFENFGINSLIINPILGVIGVSILIYLVSFLSAFLLRNLMGIVEKRIATNKKILSSKSEKVASM